MEEGMNARVGPQAPSNLATRPRPPLCNDVMPLNEINKIIK